MKILVLSNCPLLEYQGSGYVIVNTIAALESLGHEVTAVPPSSLEILPSLKGKGVIYRRAIGMALWLRKNRKQLYSTDLIIFYGAESFLALFYIKTFFKKITTLLHSNGLELHVDYRIHSFHNYLSSEKKWYSPSNRQIFSYCYKHVDAIITVSEYDQDFAIQELKLNARKVFVNELFLQDIFFQMNQLPATKQAIITYCGSWIERKGIATIQKAIPEILGLFPNYQFRLIGVGDSFRKDKYFATEVLDRIEVIPMVSNKKKLIEYYRESDIFLFPSFCESFGLVVAEAMICRCAVVTGPTGIASTLVTGREALVLPIPDPESVVNAVRTLIENKALKLSIQENAPQRIYHLNKTTYTNRLKEILSSIR